MKHLQKPKKVQFHFFLLAFETNFSFLWIALGEFARLNWEPLSDSHTPVTAWVSSWNWSEFTFCLVIRTRLRHGNSLNYPKAYTCTAHSHTHINKHMWYECFPVSKLRDWMSGSNWMSFGLLQATDLSWKNGNSPHFLKVMKTSAGTKWARLTLQYSVVQQASQ